MSNQTLQISIPTSDDITAYRVIVLLNNLLEQVGEDAKPTQMGYNYTRNGLIAKGKKGFATKIRYTQEETLSFLNKYMTKHHNTQVTLKDGTEVEGQMDLFAEVES